MTQPPENHQQPGGQFNAQPGQQAFHAPVSPSRRTLRRLAPPEDERQKPVSPCPSRSSSPTSRCCRRRCRTRCVTPPKFRGWPPPTRSPAVGLFVLFMALADLFSSMMRWPSAPTGEGSVLSTFRQHLRKPGRPDFPDGWPAHPGARLPSLSFVHYHAQSVFAVRTTRPSSRGVPDARRSS